MKKNFMLAGMVALMMASCASDDLVKEDGAGVAGEGTSFVGLSISMPSNRSAAKYAPMHRGVTYDDGVGDEYKVNDVTLVFCENSEKIRQVTKFEGDALNWNQDEEASNELTSKSVLPVVSLITNDVNRVYVLVNSSNLYNVESSTTDANNKVTNAGSIRRTGPSEEAFSSSSSLRGLLENQNIEDYTGRGTKDNFFMASAALGNSEFNNNLAVKIETSKTKEAAMNAAAQNKNVIYVERAVAKVSLGFPENNSTITLTDGSFNGDQIKFDGWTLDNTCTATYPFREVNPNWKSLAERFCSGTTPQRYEFSKGPNYDGDHDYYLYKLGSLETFYSRVNTSVTEPIYCLENTFKVSKMMQNRTTRVVLRGAYIPNGMDATEVANDGWYRLGESVKAYTKADMLAAIKTAATTAGVADIDKVEIENLKRGKNALTLAGEANVLKLYKAGNNPIDVTNDQLKAINRIVGELTYYKNGYCYYPVLIRHFSDTNYEPNEGVREWEGTNYLALNDDEPDTNKKWLGRYGVVRNNSYLINIRKVSSPGTPTIPDSPAIIDDVQNYYIQATIDILSWTKRSQDVDL